MIVLPDDVAADIATNLAVPPALRLALGAALVADDDGVARIPRDELALLLSAPRPGERKPSPAGDVLLHMTVRRAREQGLIEKNSTVRQVRPRLRRIDIEENENA